jgi:hypothetical protein
MIIPTLGTGQLYRVHHERAQMLTEIERRRAIKLCAGVAVCLAGAVLLWIFG